MLRHPLCFGFLGAAALIFRPRLVNGAIGDGERWQERGARLVDAAKVDEHSQRFLLSSLFKNNPQRAAELVQV